jgi:Tfp pilus assembly protein PilO
MKRLPPAKRNQLIGVIIATAGLICLVFFLLIQPQNEKNDSLARKIGEENLKLKQYKDAARQMEATTNALAELTEQLNLAEADVASGDLYAWTVDTIRRFKASYRVEIPTPGQPSQSDCDLIGNFPYKQIRISLTGSAYYHDLGKFIADFENKFPHCRVLNLTTDASMAGPSGGEKLVFRLDLVALVKPAN